MVNKWRQIRMLTLIKHTENVEDRRRWVWVEGLDFGTKLKVLSPAGNLYELKMTHGIWLRLSHYAK